MEESNVSKEKKCKNHLTIPNTHINYLYQTCYINCNKPYDPANPNNGDLALCLCPCALVADIVCCIPIIIGCWNIKNPSYN